MYSSVSQACQHSHAPLFQVDWQTKLHACLPLGPRTLERPSDLTQCGELQEREKRRHLLRLWVSPKDGWALPDVFAERFAGDTMTPGARGGIHVEGYEPCVPLEAC